MSRTLNSRISALWGKFSRKSYRDSFVSSHLSTNIAAQIYALREKQGLTQKELADLTGMAQARVSVLEDPEYDKATISTLKRIASAYDVALIVRFVPFSELLEWSSSQTEAKLSPVSFKEDMPPAENAGLLASLNLASTSMAYFDLDKATQQTSVYAPTSQSSDLVKIGSH